MYWCKKYFVLVLNLAMLAGVQSCKKDTPADTDTKQFFDLKNYFADESARLTKLNPVINKTTIHNAVTENKKASVANWSDELSLFAESDINKPGWQKSYSASTSEGITTYNALDPDLKTRSVIIKKQQDKVKLILIYNYTKTTLFGKALSWTTEELCYAPDSMYRIHRRHFVRIGGENKYFIKGLFN